MVNRTAPAAQSTTREGHSVLEPPSSIGVGKNKNRVEEGSLRTNDYEIRQAPYERQWRAKMKIKKAPKHELAGTEAGCNGKRLATPQMYIIITTKSEST
jgi:hypothetical protein